VHGYEQYSATCGNSQRHFDGSLETDKRGDSEGWVRGSVSQQYVVAFRPLSSLLESPLTLTLCSHIFYKITHLQFRGQSELERPGSSHSDVTLFAIPLA